MKTLFIEYVKEKHVDKGVVSYNERSFPCRCEENEHKPCKACRVGECSQWSVKAVTTLKTSPAQVRVNSDSSIATQGIQGDITSRYERVVLPPALCTLTVG